MNKPASIQPRLLTSRQAAAYLNMSIAGFERLRLGRVCFGSKVLYDREAIDAHLDEMNGLSAQSAPAANDPEAALARFTARRPDASRHS